MIGPLKIIRENRDATIYQETIKLIAFVWAFYDDKALKILMVPCCCNLSSVNQFRDTESLRAEFLFLSISSFNWKTFRKIVLKEVQNMGSPQIGHSCGKCRFDSVVLEIWFPSCVIGLAIIFTEMAGKNSRRGSGVSWLHCDVAHWRLAARLLS